MAQESIIKTLGYEQEQIIKDILTLYSPNGIDLDPTYSKGNFYKNIPEPKLKFDLTPQRNDVKEADCRKLPLENESINCMMFDPPFTAGIGKNLPNGIIRKRFSMFKNMNEAYDFFTDSLNEFYRILNKKGILIFKIQDTVSQGKQWLTHNHFINSAEKIGFYTKDLFILGANNRIIGKTHHNQQHARKYHSYFLVFVK
jgi:hypothetical protein